jgi:hypothetical protein
MHAYIDKTNAYKILVLKCEMKRLFCRCKRRWAYNIKLVVTEISCDDLDQIHLVQVRDSFGCCERSNETFRLYKKH